VKFNIYEGFGQDALGIWTAPDGKTTINWFNDREGNVLSLKEGQAANDGCRLPVRSGAVTQTA
jgi:hypothetical protein